MKKNQTPKQKKQATLKKSGAVIITKIQLLKWYGGKCVTDRHLQEFKKEYIKAYTHDFFDSIKLHDGGYCIAFIASIKYIK